MYDHSNIWKELLVNIRPKVSEVNYNNWLRQITFIGIEENKFRLGAPNCFVKDWISDYYTELLTQELYFLTQKNYTLDLEVVGEASPSVPLPAEAPQKSLLIARQETRKEPAKPAPVNLNLNKKYTFDRFVVGAANQFAHAASLAAAELPGGHYNPLFIYGGAGLGKTHLLCAVGLKIAELFPESRIHYLSAEVFTNELIFSLRFDKMDKFRKKFREEGDVFLVDDIQFIVGKERTVEEFFHTFNCLYESHRQIVVTSDRLPKDLHGLEERLRTRFEWGLIADIQPPDLETRIAILNKKSEQNGIKLDSEVAMFLATQIRSNVRELEGSLIRLSAFSSLEKVPITVELVKKVLKNIIQERASTYSIEGIQRVVADYYNIKVVDLKSQRRIKSFSVPRQIAMYLCKEHLSASYPEIGQKFGGKDHSTVIHAVKKIHRVLDTDDLLKQDIDIIEKRLIQ